MTEFTSKSFDGIVGLDDDDDDVGFLGLMKKSYLLYFWDTDPLESMVCNGDTVLSQSRLLSFKAQSPLCVLGQNPVGSATVR